jgi:hypothetical protein
VTITSTSGCEQGIGGSGGFTTGRGFPGGGSFTPPAGGFGEGGTRPTPTGTSFPGFGSGSSGRGGFAGRFGGAFGTIASITGSSFTVKSAFGAIAGATPTAATGTTTGTTTTVKTTSTTTYDVTSTGSASQVKKGLCVNAIGSDDVSGVLDARSVSISPPVNGSCPATRGFTGGFGGPGFGSGSSTGGAGGA